MRLGVVEEVTKKGERMEYARWEQNHTLRFKVVDVKLWIHSTASSYTDACALTYHVGTNDICGNGFENCGEFLLFQHTRQD